MIKGCSDPSQFIFEINVGKMRFRFKTTLNLKAVSFENDSTTSHLLLPLATAWVLHGLVNTEQQAGRLGGCSDRISFHNSRFPHTSCKVICNILIKNIDSEPNTVPGVFLTELIKNVGGIKAGIVAKLTGNHLKSLGHGTDDQLLIPSNCSAVIPEVFAELHVYGSASSDHRVILHCPPDNHDGIMQGPLGLLHELLGTSPQDYCTRLGFWAALEKVESFSSNLFLFKCLTMSKSGIVQIMYSRLNCSSTSLQSSVHVFLRNSSSTEHVPVSEVLRGNISNREFRQYNLSSRGCDAVKFVIQNVPLSIHNLLVFCDILEPDFGIVFFSFQFQFDVQKGNFGICVILLLHFKSCIAKSFLERNSRNQLSVLQCPASDLFDPNHVKGESLFI